MVAEQLCVMAEAVRETRSRQEEDIASGLLSVAFLLVEDDVDAVVTAAEAAVATVASLLEDTQEGHELVMTQIANLATGEEEEIRVSGAKIVGSLASVLWPTAAKNDLTPLLEKLAQDSAYHVREVTIHSLVLVGRCRLTVSKPVLKAPVVSALETMIRYIAFKVCFQFQLTPLHPGGRGVGDVGGGGDGAARVLRTAA